MKLWDVQVIQPKRKDRRRARFKVVYTVHAKSVAEVRRLLLASVYDKDGETIGTIVEVKYTIFNSRYFSISPDADI